MQILGGFIMSLIYDEYNIWLTIDVEEIVDTNFNIKWKSKVDVDYEQLIDNWLKLNDELNYKSTCFVLGSFAKKYPHLVKKLSMSGHEIASHGMNHDLVNKIPFEEWKESLKKSKMILEDITGKKVYGYRSASWSLPFDKKYYEELILSGYTYSSSYFPLKTYMYGNRINKKEPFIINTDSGQIKEIPIIKCAFPFSGGFYLRVLPLYLEQYLFRSIILAGYKPVLYIHPYELMNRNLINYFIKHAYISIDFLLAFYSSKLPKDKIRRIIKYANK